MKPLAPAARGDGLAQERRSGLHMIKTCPARAVENRKLSFVLDRSQPGIKMRGRAPRDSTLGLLRGLPRTQGDGGQRGALARNGPRPERHARDDRCTSFPATAWLRRMIQDWFYAAARSFRLESSVEAKRWGVQEKANVAADETSMKFCGPCTIIRSISRAK